MITFINEDLFSIVAEKKEGKEGRPDYYRSIVSSSMNVENRRNPDNPAPKVIEHVLHTDEELNKTNTQIGVRMVDKRSIIRLNQKDTNKYDTAVFFIAAPYNGFVIPVERSNKFQIYKGFTTTLVDPVEVGEDTYKHVAYLILVPNRKLLLNDELCDFNLESFSNRTVDGEQTTIKTTYTIEFYLRDGVCDYAITSTEEETDPVNASDYKGKKTFPIFIPKKKEDNQNKGKKPNGKDGKPSGNRPSNRSKNGLYQNNRSNDSNEHLTHHVSDSLDDMIRNAELDDGHVKNKRGKKRNKRR